jgi:hypothetical protein
MRTLPGMGEFYGNCGSLLFSPDLDVCNTYLPYFCTVLLSIIIVCVLWCDEA